MSLNIVIHLDYQMLTAAISVGGSLNSIVSHRLSPNKSFHYNQPRTINRWSKGFALDSQCCYAIPSLLKLLVQSYPADKLLRNNKEQQNFILSELGTHWTQF